MKMIEDSKLSTEDALRFFSEREQQDFRKIILCINFLENIYYNLKSNLYLFQMLLYALKNLKNNKSIGYLFPLIESLHRTISLDISLLAEKKSRDDDITVNGTISLIEAHKKSFLRFLNERYKHDMTENHFSWALNQIKTEYAKTQMQGENFVKMYRNKQVAHFTSTIFKEEEMVNVIRQQKMMFLAYMSVFKLVISIVAKYPLIAEPIVSKMDEKIIICNNLILKKLGLYKYIKGKIIKEILKDLGFQENKHYTIVFRDGKVIKS